MPINGDGEIGFGKPILENSFESKQGRCMCESCLECAVRGGKVGSRIV